MKVRFLRAWGGSFVENEQFEAGDEANLPAEAVAQLQKYEAVELLEPFPEPVAPPVVRPAPAVPAARKGGK